MQGTGTNVRVEALKEYEVHCLSECKLPCSTGVNSLEFLHKLGSFLGVVTAVCIYGILVWRQATFLLYRVLSRYKKQYEETFQSKFKWNCFMYYLFWKHGHATKISKQTCATFHLFSLKKLSVPQLSNLYLLWNKYYDLMHSCIFITCRQKLRDVFA